MIFIFVAAILFGLVHPGSKLILNQGIDLMSFCILYVLIRLIVQLPFIIKSKSYLVSKNESWVGLILIGITGAGLQFSEFKGIASGLSVPMVSFLVYSHPIWSLIFSRVINKEPLNMSSFIQLISGLIGVVFIVGGENDLLIGKIDFTKLMAPLIAGVFIALWVSLSNRAKRTGSSSWTISFYFDFFALCALLGMRLAHVTPDAMEFAKMWTWISIAKNFVSISSYSILIGLLPNILFYQGSLNTPARTVGLILLIEPIVATLVSHWLWFDQLSKYFIIGVIFILFAGMPIKSLWINYPLFSRLKLILASLVVGSLVLLGFLLPPCQN